MFLPQCSLSSVPIGLPASIDSHQQLPSLVVIYLPEKLSCHFLDTEFEHQHNCSLGQHNKNGFSVLQIDFQFTSQPPPSRGAYHNLHQHQIKQPGGPRNHQLFAHRIIARTWEISRNSKRNSRKGQLRRTFSGTNEQQILGVRKRTFLYIRLQIRHMMDFSASSGMNPNNLQSFSMSVSNVTGPCHKKHRYLHTLNTGHLEPHIMELNIVSRALVDALV